MRTAFLLLLLLGVSGSAFAQACGYSFLTVYLVDSKGRTITNARISTFDRDFKKHDRLHYPRHDDSPDPLSNKIAWSEKKQAYFGSEGLCGGHREVGLRVEADGFEHFDKVIDLPLGWTSYAISLRRSGTSDMSSAMKLSQLIGNLTDVNHTAIPLVEVVVIGEGGPTLKTLSNERGRFEFDLPSGIYSLTISSGGFKRLKVINLSIVESDTEFLNLILQARDADWTEEILDYKTIKKKEN